ncbi:MAG TPA: IS1595 family transposase [Gaiellaceae bacterium]|nr:IS1595 family transposase [Gaiellaceae bacterium]
MREFPDDRACLDFLWRQMYAPDGHHTHCPKCDRERKFHRVKDRPSYDCDSCGHHIHPLAGTIFHKSATSLHLWFYAMYVMASTRCGVSAKQLERELGVTYKTAWRMFNLIRNQVMADDAEGPLSGEVEADETWHGGKLRSRDRRRAITEGRSRTGQYVRARATVFGIVERSGRVVAMHIPSRYGYTLRATIRERVEPGSVVYTDDFKGYDGIERLYTRRTINHTARIYADGGTHTQTIEGFFSLFKNGVRGVYHSVSIKWLQGYLNEYTWRYNRRDNGRAMFLDLIAASASRVR